MKPMSRDRQQQQRPPPEAREVAEYLKEHPDFLARRPAVLAAIDIPRETPSGTVSLVERQVAALRQKQEATEKKLRELAAVARTNEKLQERMSAFAVHCAGAWAIEQVLVMLPGKLKREFKLEHATMCADAREAGDADNKHWFATDHRYYSRVRNRVERGDSVCLDNLPNELLSFLFDGHAGVGSCALIPLIAPGRSLRGVLALGSKDPKRFNADMGTVYLDFLGRVAGTALNRLVRT